MLTTLFNQKCPALRNRPMSELSASVDKSQALGEPSRRGATNSGISAGFIEPSSVEHDDDVTGCNCGATRQRIAFSCLDDDLDVVLKSAAIGHCVVRRRAVHQDHSLESGGRAAKDRLQVSCSVHGWDHDGNPRIAGRGTRWTAARLTELLREQCPPQIVFRVQKSFQFVAISTDGNT
jgi:hypothetical protein